MSRARRLVATIGGGAIAALLIASPARADDCTEEALKQIHELTDFSKMSGMENCSTAEGRAIYEKEAKLLKILDQRDRVLNSICPESNHRWEYARKTFRTLSHVFSIASKGCGG